MNSFSVKRFASFNLTDLRYLHISFLFFFFFFFLSTYFISPRPRRIQWKRKYKKQE